MKHGKFSIIFFRGEPISKCLVKDGPVKSTVPLRRKNHEDIFKGAKEISKGYQASVALLDSTDLDSG